MSIMCAITNIKQKMSNIAQIIMYYNVMYDVLVLQE